MFLSSRKSSIHSLASRVRLASAFGFIEYPANPSIEPYLDYILKQYAGNATTEEHVELFIEVVEHFRTNRTPSVQALLDKYTASGFRNVFTDTKPGDPRRKEHVEDTIMCICGTWATMLSSFQHKSRARKVVAAYNLFANQSTLQAATLTTVPPNPMAIAPYNESLAGLINGSSLLPGGQWDYRISYENDAATKLVGLMFNAPNGPNQNSLQMLTHKGMHTSASHISPYTLPYALLEDLNAQETQSIRAVRLNAFTLNVLSAVDVLWTPNVSRHMLLTRVNGHVSLELFSLPCAFDAITSAAVSIPVELTQEIEESYAVLFNAWTHEPWHVKLGKFVGIRKLCWCWSCSAARYRQRCIAVCKTGAPATSPRKTKVASNMQQGVFDPTLEKLMKNQSMGDWTPDDFPTLWPRIARLEQHLQTSRPWSLSVLFRDRRDTMQFWTFLFATVVVLLTILQVMLGVAQVVGSFK